MRLSAIGAVIACCIAGAAPANAVVGGQPVTPGDLQSVANVRIGGLFGCTGTLVAPEWVVTAGHCGSVTGPLDIPTPIGAPASFYTVDLGSVRADGSGAERHEVSALHVDTDYIVTNGVGNDVTLLKLATPSKITPMQIVAPGNRDIWKAGTLATVAGFGLTKEDGDAPDVMQQAKVPIATDDYCAAAYPKDGIPFLAPGGFDPATMLCAGYPRGGIDTCTGDSGGPLLAALPNGALRLVGATSYGDGCARPGKPGVYARLAEGRIREFIRKTAPAALAPEYVAPAAPPASTRARVRLTALALQLKRKAVTTTRAARLRWNLNRAATVYITFRKVGGRGSRHLVRRGRAGGNSLRFTARIKGSGLTPGRWRVRIAARDTDGHRTRVQTRAFRVARR